MTARRLRKAEQLAPDSRYELLFLLASGGMGSVYLGVARGTTSPLYAIKRAHPHLLDQSEFRKMFVAEARLASRIRHENAVGVVEVDESEGELNLVMEYVRGGSLSDVLLAASEGQRRLPPAFTLRVICDAARGLHAAHETLGPDGRSLGIVHRDVSPHNILVGVNGLASITDFGVAKAVSLDVTRTGSEVLKGKAAYMAPEYLLKRVSSPRTDVFSLGVVCWEALAHKRLFRGHDEIDTMERIRNPEPAPILTGITSIDANVAAVVARALSKDPDKRFATALELADALEGRAHAAELMASRAEVGALVHELLSQLLAERDQLVAEALGLREGETLPGRRASGMRAAAASNPETLTARHVAEESGVSVSRRAATPLPDLGIATVALQIGPMAHTSRASIPEPHDPDATRSSPVMASRVAVADAPTGEPTVSISSRAHREHFGTTVRLPPAEAQRGSFVDVSRPELAQAGRADGASRNTAMRWIAVGTFTTLATFGATIAVYRASRTTDDGSVPMPQTAAPSAITDVRPPSTSSSPPAPPTNAASAAAALAPSTPAMATRPASSPPRAAPGGGRTAPPAKPTGYAPPPDPYNQKKK